MAKPAVPPAIMTADKLRLDGSCPSGVKLFLTNSYATKYLQFHHDQSPFFPSFLLPSSLVRR